MSTRTLGISLAIVIGIGLASGPPASAREPAGGYGGEDQVTAESQCVTEEQRAAIWERLRENIAKLRAEGVIQDAPPAALRATNPVLTWPLRPAAHLKDEGYHCLLQFVDQNPSFPNFLLDYNCGTRTYDTSAGYNHSGVDYGNWPFEWLKMDQGDVEIVAAAPGFIIGKDDGFFDRSCVNNSNDWNAVYVQHADGSIAWYGHMRNGSPTSKAVGAPVERGEYLGIVGSSGNSSAVHLHLEVYASGFVLNDPYQGACNSMNAASWWASQRPYYDSAVNRAATSFAAPNFPTCPNPEDPNEAVDFNFGDTLYFTAYYRDQLPSQTATYTVRRPDGSVYDTWTHHSAIFFVRRSWWWDLPSFAPGGPAGIWRFEVAFEGKTYQHLFRLAAPTGSGRVPGQLLDDVAPLTASRAGSEITLDWNASCVSTDTDYEVYEGTLGSWYSHGSLLCSTGGSTAVTFTPGSGDTYYLVVPTNGSVEGSYGFDDAFAERPQGAPSCHPQQIGGNCPQCGDAVREDPEVCDRFDFGGETCQSQGFGSGNLICTGNCAAFDLSNCNPCGNDVCQPGFGEDCLSCPADCNGVQGGSPANRYCCGDGDGQNPVGCGDPRCTANGNTCVP
jgi:hypothetical protein